jgi:4-hydroxybenzoate polyprenyltransferase
MGVMLLGLLGALRPHQWSKNVFVLAPLVFAQALDDPTSVQRAGWAFVAFCLASSAVYLFNDILDRDEDRKHPLKRHRPFAAGTVPVPIGIVTALGLATAALMVASRLNRTVVLVLGLYLGLNLLYTLGLKRVVILDVLIISVGFVLRVLGGGHAIEVEVSDWLLMCTIFVSLLLALSKRRHELILLANHAADQRHVLGQYSAPFLDQMVNVVTASSVLSYALYAVAPETVENFGGGELIYTLPFVLFGIFRYLYLIYHKKTPRNPTEALLWDAPFMANMVLWAGAVLWIVYLA